MKKFKPLEDCKTINEMKKSLRLAWQYQRAFEEAFKKYGLEETYKRMRKELYGIYTDS